MAPRSRIRPSRYAPWDAVGALTLLEDAVARLIDGVVEFPGPAGDTPRDVAAREEAADRVVDLLAARAWHGLPKSSHGDAQDVSRRCAAYVLAADLARVGGPRSPTLGGAGRGVLHRLTGEALLLLTLPEHFDAATARARELLGTAPAGRLAAAWRMTDEALAALGTTRHEWVGADPAVVAAAGWVLVDRVGRVLLASALTGQAAAASGPTVETLVNAARRYAWNHLRRPAPEAATPIHVRRSLELVRALAPVKAGEAG